VQMFDEDEAWAIDSFARLGALALPLGLTPSIEFMGFDQPQLLDRTMRIILAAGIGTLTIDPLHIVRSNLSLDALRRIDPARIGYVQLCDGPLQAPEADYPFEAGRDRLPPGEGEFPLAEIMAVVPDGRPVSLEVPNDQLRDQGVSPETRCRAAVEATRRLFERLDREPAREQHFRRESLHHREDDDGH
jgi:sugar phosphate isomerase/epimerase